MNFSQTPEQLRTTRTAYINEHREATGHSPFTTLTEDEVQHHLALIDKYAAYGSDPWGNYTSDPFTTTES